MMCIVCNCPGHEAESELFLREYEAAQVQMKKAAAAMLVCSQVAATVEIRKRYDVIHKSMVRQIGEWNKIEHLREHRDTDQVDATHVKS